MPSNKMGWILVGAAITLVVLFLVANQQRTTRHDAGEEIKEAAQTTADYVKDTAHDIKNDVRR